MIPIDNLYETLRSALHYNRFEIGKLLFVEYTCPIRDDYACVWTQTDYLIHHCICAEDQMMIKLRQTMVHKHLSQTEPECNRPKRNRPTQTNNRGLQRRWRYRAN
jgi:hypothetical protein